MGLRSLGLLLLVLLACRPVQAGMTLLQGRVLTESGPLADAVVSAYGNYDDLRRRLPPVAATRAGRDGVYRLELPPGAYHFTAAGESDGRRYFAYHGGNPVSVTGREGVWLPLLATPGDLPVTYREGVTGVEGRVTYRGKPLEGGYLALYEPSGRTFKGLGVKTESLGKDGRFRIMAEPGSYVVTARRSAGAVSNRPLRQGDLYCYYADNPVEVTSGRTAVVEFSCYPKDQRSEFVAAPPVKPENVTSIAGLAAASGAGLRGRVVDEEGRPVVGVNVLAYRLASPVFMMYHVYHGSEYASLTDREGQFFIPLDRDGEYGLVAREVLGDGPHRGERYGLYQGNVRHAVTFRQGETVDNLTIVAGRVMEESGGQSGRKVNPRTVVGVPGGAPTVLGDTVIDQDTVWQGEIVIKGVISVSRGATLVIRPGTKIRFKRIDRDRNGVGDGEILVEGRLIARGNAEAPITFASAEERPEPGDWSYLQFLASNRGNLIEWCRFEHAFAGVMIHYAEVKISDSLFRNNNRGLHYNTADLQVRHSTFTENRIGIRFMRLEGTVGISDSEISRNEVGLLFVRQHVNAVDFDRLNSGREVPRIEGNNIFDNRNYNFSLGEGQDRDIQVAGNWWGSALKEAIAEKIYDRSKEPSLSRIGFDPFLHKPVTGAGVRGVVQEGKTASPRGDAGRIPDRSQLATISGRVLLMDGTPLSRGLLYLYNLNRGPLPSAERYWRVPNQVQEIDREGRFSTPVPPGVYSIGAIRRTGELQIGPPGPGDLFLLSLDEAGLPRRYTLEAGSTSDLGDIRQARSGHGQEPVSAPRTAIEGVVTDRDGKPLEGVYVFAFARGVVAGKPLFAAGPSNSRGAFRLDLPEGGTFHLKARSDLGGGPPQAGLVIDGKKGEPMLAVSVETGEVVTGVALSTRVFQGRGRSDESETAP